MSNEKYDRDTLGYYPYHDECPEMGLSIEEFEYGMNNQYTDYDAFSRIDSICKKWVERNDARILKEQVERLNKDRQLASIKKERSIIKEVNHWYNALPKDTVLSLIEGSRILCDEYIDRSQLSESLERKKVYNEKLRERVKVDRLVFRDSNGKNISRFPRYDATNNKLVGSSFAFVTMWSHVFSSKP